MGRRVRHAIGAVLVGAGLVACGAERPSTAPPEQDGPTRPHAVPAVVLGDSLTVQATEQIRAKIPLAVIDAAAGRTMVRPSLTDEGLSRVPALVATDPGWFVVELGTNDATFVGRGAAEMAGDVEALIDAIGRDRCIAWVLPYAGEPATPVQIADTETFRRIATSAVETLTCGRVLDWGAVASEDPNLLASDGVHLSDLGMQRMADLIVFGIG